MRALLGLIQIGCAIYGIVALIGGRWLLGIGFWVAAGLVGVVGNRLTRAIYGVSETGRDVPRKVSHAMDLLERREYRIAAGVARSAVSDARLGGDKALLPITLTIHAVALACQRELSEAQQVLFRARDALTQTRNQLNSPQLALFEMEEMLEQTHRLVQRAIDDGVPDPSRLAADFLALNRAA